MGRSSVMVLECRPIFKPIQGGCCKLKKRNIMCFVKNLLYPQAEEKVKKNLILNTFVYGQGHKVKVIDHSLI